jgi:hypothetical protein
MTEDRQEHPLEYKEQTVPSHPYVVPISTPLQFQWRTESRACEHAEQSHGTHGLLGVQSDQSWTIPLA